MDFRRLTKRPVAGAAEKPAQAEEKAPQSKSPPKAATRRASKPALQSKPRPQPFTVPDGGRLHFYRIHPESEEMLELLGVEEAKEIAGAIADLRGEAAWCIYLETRKGRQLVAVSEAMIGLLD